jgi:hypothetical protein
MKMLMFEGIPEEFARVEHMFAAGGRAVTSRAPMLPAPRAKVWPELTDEQRYELAKAALEKAPKSVRDALAWLADLNPAQDPDLEFSIPSWAGYANMRPEAVCGYLAELSRCVGRAFAELFGHGSTPASARGGAYLLLEKLRDGDTTVFAIRPATRKAMSDLGLV